MFHYCQSVIRILFFSLQIGRCDVLIFLRACGPEAFKERSADIPDLEAKLGAFRKDVIPVLQHVDSMRRLYVVRPSCWW